MSVHSPESIIQAIWRKYIFIWLFLKKFSSDLKFSLFSIYILFQCEVSLFCSFFIKYSVFYCISHIELCINISYMHFYFVYFGLFGAEKRIGLNRPDRAASFINASRTSSRIEMETDRVFSARPGPSHECTRPCTARP